MPPEQQNNEAVLAAINSLKAEFNQKFEEQQSTFEERLKPVEDIQQTLEQARQAQLASQQPQQPQTGWQPKTWDEIPQMIETKAGEIARKTLEERDKAAQTAAERQTNDERELEAQIDRQLSELEKSGYLPHINNPNDYNDPGVATRRELLAAASHMGTPELDKVAGTLAEMHKNDMVFNPQTKTYDTAKGTLTPLPGKFAPVGNSSQHAPGSASGPSYDQIHNARDFDSLMALAEQQGYGPAPSVSNVDTGF